MKYIKLFENKEVDLFKAIVIDDTNRVRHLIKTGANINIQDSEGRTPLFYAANHDYMHVVYLLIEAGADWNIINNKGYDFTYLLSDKQIDFIKNKYPEQYNTYKMKKTADKFNL